MIGQVFVLRLGGRTAFAIEQSKGKHVLLQEGEIVHVIELGTDPYWWLCLYNGGIYRIHQVHFRPIK